MSRRQKMEMRKSLEVRSKGERGFNKIYWAKNMFRWRKIYECKQARQNMRMTKSLKVRIGRRGLLGGFNKVFWAPPISNPSDSNTNSILSSSFSTLSDFIPCFGRLKKLYNWKGGEEEQSWKRRMKKFEYVLLCNRCVFSPQQILSSIALCTYVSSFCCPVLGGPQ